MIFRFWKTKWNVPVLPKIYSGNCWAQRGGLQPGQQEKQQRVLVLAALKKLRADSKKITFHAADRNVLTWPLLMHFTSALKANPPATGQAKENRLECEATGNRKNFSRCLVWARGEMICDYYCRLGGVVCLAAALSIRLHGLGRGNQREGLNQATGSNHPWAS